MLKPTPENAVLHPNRAATDLKWPWHFNVGRDAECPTPWTFTVKRLPESHAWHLLLAPLLAFHNNQADQFLLLSPSIDEAPDDEMAQLHYTYVDRRTREPIHPTWAPWLWHRALALKEATILEGTGRNAWLCDPDYPRMAREISAAIVNGELSAD